MTSIPRTSRGRRSARPAGRIAALVLAAACAAGTVAAAPGAAVAADPLGGPAMGTSGTRHVHGAKAFPNTYVKARAFVVADLGTGAVYAARRPHHELKPASTIKTLTALTILRNVPLDTKVKMTSAVRGAECSCVGLQRGKTYTVNALLHALIMRSGNDAAELLAMSTGSRARTLTLMRNTARELRALDTYAVTPSGLDRSGDGQHTSAYDLALIQRAAFADPRFRKIMATRTFSFGPVGGPTKKLVTQNELYHMRYRGEIGSKNGWTRAAQQTFVAAATRGGRTLVVTLMHNDKGIAKQAKALLDWGFALPAAPRSIGTLVPPRTPKPTATPTATATPSRAVSAGAAAKTVQQPAQTTRPARTTQPAQTVTASPSASPSPEPSAEPTPAGGLQVPVQTSLSLGAIGFAGLALFPRRRPRPVAPGHRRSPR
jgi:D-alanyl-D-alanine carboxypeptidase (penicillin-binding protein 5/6)